jgi:drug/metabolite transporter (DMT)-like permease
MLTSLPLLLWEAGRGAAQWPDQAGWVITLYTAIFPSLVAQILYIKGVVAIGANRAGRKLRHKPCPPHPLIRA